LRIIEVYKVFIIDHGKTPRNFNIITDPTHSKEGFNHLCGDKIKIYITIKKQIIQKISFQGKGCIISVASASIMTELLKGKCVEYALNLFTAFINFIIKNKKNKHMLPKKLKVFAGVKKFPARIKCVTLAWYAMHSATNN